MIYSIYSISIYYTFRGYMYNINKLEYLKKNDEISNNY